MHSQSRLLSVAMLAVMLSSADASAQVPPAKPDMQLRETVTGMPRGEKQEIQVLTATIAPGQATPFHTHRFPVTIMVLEGTFTLEMEGRPPTVVKAGQAFIEPPNVHMTGYNRSATEPMHVVIFYVGDPGAPFLDVARK